MSVSRSDATPIPHVGLSGDCECSPTDKVATRQKKPVMFAPGSDVDKKEK